MRSKYPETLVDLFRRVSDVFRGAGLMAGVGVEIIADGDITTGDPLIRVTAPPEG